MGNAQQGDALPGAVGIFQPIAGLGAEKPGFRIPAPAAVGGMENPVVRNEVGQLPLAEHRKVEAVAPWQIPRGIFRCKGNAPLGKHPGDFLVAAGGDAAAAPGSARHQGVLADQFLLAALAPAPPENATPCPPLPTVLQHGAFPKPLALQVPYPILMGTPAAAGVPTFQFMGVHLHHLTAVALTLPDCTSIGAPRLRQRQDGQAAKSLAGKVIRTRVGRQPQLFTPPERSPPVVAWCCRPQSHRHSHTRCPPCRWGSTPSTTRRWKRCPVRSWRWAAWAWFLAWVTSRRRQPQLWVIPRRRLVPRVVIPPPHWQVQRYQASRPVTPAGAGTCSTTVSRPKVFPTMGTLALVTPSPLSSMGKPQYR